MKAWSATQFMNTLRTGVTPSGRQLRREFMPWDFKGQMTDDELRGVWARLTSLPSLRTSTAPTE